MNFDQQRTRGINMVHKALLELQKELIDGTISEYWPDEVKPYDLEVAAHINYISLEITHFLTVVADSQRNAELQDQYIYEINKMCGKIREAQIQREEYIGMDDAQKRLDKIKQELCWYPFGMCSTKAENKTKKWIGSDPMQYCKQHDTEMRKRYALEGGA